MKKILIFLSFVIVCGCAHVINGDNQTVFIQTSDSKRVKANIHNGKADYTQILPAYVEIPKSKTDLTITTINTECITSTTTLVKSKVDPVAYANIFTLGLGFIVDLYGSMWQYEKVLTVDVKRDNSCIQTAKKLNEEMAKLHKAK